MIEQLTPSYCYTCDRCGKKQFFNERERSGIHSIAFRCISLIRIDNEFSGDVCDECYTEFKEIAENFFNEVNKE